MNLLEKTPCLSSYGKESFVFLLSLSVSLSLSLSLSLSVSVCVCLSEAEMAISGASVSKETKFRTKLGTKFRTKFRTKLGKKEREREGGPCKERVWLQKGSLFCLFPFYVGLESKEHNTFWESKRNSKAKQSKAKPKNKAAAAAASPPEFTQFFSQVFLGSSPLFLFWVAKFWHRGQSKAKQKSSVILWYRVYAWFFLINK